MERGRPRTFEEFQKQLKELEDKVRRDNPQLKKPSDQNFRRGFGKKK